MNRRRFLVAIGSTVVSCGLAFSRQLAYPDNFGTVTETRDSISIVGGSFTTRDKTRFDRLLIGKKVVRIENCYFKDMPVDIPSRVKELHLVCNIMKITKPELVGSHTYYVRREI